MNFTQLFLLMAFSQITVYQVFAGWIFTKLGIETHTIQLEFSDCFQYEAFLKAFKEADIKFTEPEVIEAPYVPGIDYEGVNRLGKEKMKDDFQIISHKD